MTNIECDLATGCFASACERMNEFARRLQGTEMFRTVKVGADIRFYETGWKLEKWVEAEINRSKGLWAAWWLELGPKDHGWLIESHVSVSPDEVFIGLQDRFATASEVKQVLSAAVEQLTQAMNSNKEFLEALQKLRD